MEEFSAYWVYNLATLFGFVRGGRKSSRVGCFGQEQLLQL
jgi:hypothetical protein